MMLSAPAGNDILFDEALCEQGRNFCNKIWNAFRLVKGWETAEAEQPQAAKTAIRWFDAQLRKSAADIAGMFKRYRLSEALMEVYRLFWDEFSSWYLEMVKPAYGAPIDRATYDATIAFFDTLLKLLHPFMPFITEELWQHIFDRKDGESIMVSPMTIAEPTAADSEILGAMENVKSIIAGVRAIRNQKNLPLKESLDVEVLGDMPLTDYESTIQKMANVGSIRRVTTKSEGASCFMVGTIEFAVPLGALIDVNAEIVKIEGELAHLTAFLGGIKKKLANAKFVANAPAQVVELERKKESDTESKIASLQEALAALKK